MFCASASGYRYIYSSQLLRFMLGGEREKELCATLTMFALLIIHDYA